MSSEEVLVLRMNNEKLLKTNRQLTEMLRLMDKFRVLLISMVNNCKCNTETNIRIRFNLLMEEYYHLNDTNPLKSHNLKSSPLSAPEDHSCHQIDVNSVVSNLLTQTEDNSLCLDANDNPLITEVIAHDTSGQKQSIFDSMTKSEDGKDLDLRERIARLKRYVARPKIYSRTKRSEEEKTDHSFACIWPGCQKQFKAKVDMKTHLWRHTGDKQYVCEWPGCGKRFPIKRNLTRHRETHEGVKGFACDWPGCEYKSWYPQGVRAHRKRHTDERPYKCDHCEWTFRQSHHLKAHLLKHTGEKPFECVHAGCEQRFQSRQAMKFHCQRTHRQKAAL